MKGGQIEPPPPEIPTFKKPNLKVNNRFIENNYLISERS